MPRTQIHSKSLNFTQNQPKSLLKVTAQSHCSEMLVSATLSSVFLWLCSTLLRAWICTGSHEYIQITGSGLMGPHVQFAPSLATSRVKNICSCRNNTYFLKQQSENFARRACARMRARARVRAMAHVHHGSRAPRLTHRSHWAHVGPFASNGRYLPPS